MAKLFLILLLCAATLTGFPAFSAAIPSPVSGVALKNDSSVIIKRSFDTQKIKSYSHKSEFIYQETPPADLSWWTRFWRWFWDLFEGVLKNDTYSGVIKYVIIAALAGLVVFLVIKLIGLDLKIFIGKSKAVEVPYVETLDNIHDINFNDEIEKATAAGNFRLAVRLFYLNALKVLSDRQLIDWQPEKTNQAYVSELQEGAHRDQFRQLTRNFEYIWYGEFFIDSAHFNEVKRSFDQFNRKGS